MDSDIINSQSDTPEELVWIEHFDFDFLNQSESCRMNGVPFPGLGVIAGRLHDELRDAKNDVSKLWELASTEKPDRRPQAAKKHANDPTPGGLDDRAARLAL